MSWSRRGGADKGKSIVLHIKESDCTVFNHRAEIERSQLVDLLDASFKGQTSSGCDKVSTTTELSEYLRNVQNMVLKPKLIIF